MANPVTEWQVITKDPSKHSQFYSTVFGWNIRSDNPLGYRMVDSDPGGIAGGFGPRLQKHRRLYSSSLK